MDLLKNSSKNINVKATSFANSPPNQMSHCPQWGSDWKVREGSATSSMVSGWWDVILCLGRLRAADEAVGETTAAAASMSNEVVEGAGWVAAAGR